MNAAIETREFLLEPANNRVLANLCGQFDEHLRQIEKRLGVRISNRGNHFRVVGPGAASEVGARIIQELYELAGRENLDSRRVHICLQETAMTNNIESITGGTEPGVPDQPAGEDEVIVTRRARIKPRGPNQRAYVASLRDSDLSFGIGPAGTGKTYLAVARAVEALDREGSASHRAGAPGG